MLQHKKVYLHNIWNIWKIQHKNIFLDKGKKPEKC